MPRVRRGPSGPKRGAGGKPGTNKPTPKGGAGTSRPTKSRMTGGTGGRYSKKKGY